MAVNWTECGPLGPSSFTTRLAPFTPTSFGANRTVSVHVVSGASVRPAQLPAVIRKLFGFWPPRWTREIVSGPLVRFVRVTVLGDENVPA